jgi:NAD(P)-dependent dehydrogenase (short-subunit alcohol dehydrogenase family)
MMTRGLAANGATVYILGRRLNLLQEVAKSIGPSVIPVECDVTQRDSLKAAVDKVALETGFVNLLVCNSGIGGPQAPRPQTTPALTLEDFATQNFEIPPEEYTNTFAVNTTSVWYTTMAFLPLLGAGNQKGNVAQTSQVVATSSIGGFNKINTGGFAYGQSKAACTHLIKHLANALPKWDIRANVICPGCEYPTKVIYRRENSQS